MAKIVSSSYAINLLDDLARKETSIHKLHPLIKLLTTVVYLAAVVSFGRYEIGSLLPFVFYPVLLFIFADLPARVLKRILLVLPFIICIGILNPLFDNYTVLIGGYAVSRGWITCISIFIKGALILV
jgi:cobalt/nickel transport system permease protein